MNNYTLTITIQHGADISEAKHIGNKMYCHFTEFMHRIMYGKKLAKKGAEVFYCIAETTLADCIAASKSN